MKKYFYFFKKTSANDHHYRHHHQEMNLVNMLTVFLEQKLFFKIYKVVSLHFSINLMYSGASIVVVKKC